MIWSAPNLPQKKHCFFGRKGGVSEGIYQSLNANFKSRDSKETSAATAKSSLHIMT